MTEKRYGAVIVQRESGTDLPSVFVRFLRSIEEKKFRHIYDGDTPTVYGRYTGRHELFDGTDGAVLEDYPEYDLEIDNKGEIQLRRREKSIEDELFSIDYIERTESPNL